MNPENLVGKGFDKNPQNINREGKKVGTKNRSTIAKQILNTMVNVPAKQREKLLEFFPELPEQVTMEELMTMAATARSLKRDMAYKVVMDSAYGTPKQEIDMVGEIKITDHKLTIEIVKPPED